MEGIAEFVVEVIGAITLLLMLALGGAIFFASIKAIQWMIA